MSIPATRSTQPERNAPDAPSADAVPLANLVRDAVRRCSLDLTGLTVLTEAATGAYAVTPVMAALAGARRVWAVTRSSRFGTIDEVRRQTDSLARELGVADRIEIITEITRSVAGAADIVTNSGHVRPIGAPGVDGAGIIAWMRPTTVVPLMYEAWEFRASDIDLGMCRQRGVTVVGTNERHASIDVFSYLGPLAVRLLEDAGVHVRGGRVLLLCDNPFSPYIERGLADAGATVDMRDRVNTCDRAVDAAGAARPDAILVALQPRYELRVGAAEARIFARAFRGATVAQFWGDMDRAALAASDVRYWPLDPPPPGHMGILLSALGPEPVVRLQAGGLKSAELAARLRKRGLDASKTAGVLRRDARVTLIDGDTLV